MGYRLFFTLFVLAWLSGCANLESSRLLQNPSYADLQTRVSDVPFFAQQDYYCGPAAMASMLNWSGVSVAMEQLVPQVYIPERQGSLQLEMVTVARRYQRVPYRLNPTLETLLLEVAAGHPVLVLQNLGLEMLPAWHYAVVIGVDMPGERVILHSGEYPDYTLAISTFERTWLRVGNWALVILPPEKLPATAQVGPFTRSVNALEQIQDYETAARAYRSARRRWPQDKNLIMALANVYYKQQYLEQAVEEYKKLIALDPAFAPAHNNLAQTYYDLGRKALAREHVDKAIALGGQHLQVYRQTLELIEQGRP